ncbi:glycosyl hydrolase family protein [Deinococcus aerius]|uniref:Glycosyl hydrolase family protein n=1 Tax=Deinococcus aerius TaxID=200253 RepID=A0A2I9DZ35_9DEIO|nr:NPCBM/NEW2 domain-containing protein [Deinococcus aerius]GBF06225.1 glycosyl hydrolase family protein [Deinococcus aerius]
MSNNKMQLPTSRTALFSLGVLGLTLALAACGSTPPAQTQASQDSTPTYTYDGTDHSWSSSGGPSLQPLTITAGDNGLSYESWITATNGWGPIERDRSNGEKNAGDGRTLTIGGVTFDKGFGAHSNSSMSFKLNGQCSTFTASVGVDDESGNKGSVVFQVYGDGTKLYDSGVMRGTDGAKALSVSVSGKNELRLVVTDAGDGISYDHADWVNTTLRGCTSGTSSSPAPAPAPAPSDNIQYSGRLIITKGGTYSGNWESTENRAAVIIQTDEPVIIENSNIRSRGNLISGFGNRVTIRNVRGYALNPNVAGKTTGKAVNAEEVRSLTVENSYFENTTGIYIRSFYGDPARGDGIRILRNQFRNINGLKSDGAGGYTKEAAVVQAVLFNAVRRAPGVEVAWNEIINEPGKSRTEETINLNGSSGTPASPMKIHDNYIQGAYPVDPATTTSYPGGGILLGDGKVSNPLDNGYAWAYNNQIVGTTNHGLAIVGGVGNQIFNNRAVSSGRMPDGTRLPSVNVGVYVWDMYGAGSLSVPTFANNVMRDNVIGWTKVNSNGTTTNNPTWFPNCGLNGTVCSNNQSLGTVTLDMERAEWTRWQDKLASAGIKVGPR